MLLFMKKKTDHESAPEEPAAAARELFEFIPYHSHYDAHTLLTRNGELMQIIRIDRNATGLNYESDDDGYTVREHIRKAIKSAVTSNRYALWLHTIRKRKAVHYSSRHDNPLAAYLYETWQRLHRWKYQYYNEIYLTVLIEGQSSTLFDKAMLQNVLLPGKNRSYRNRYLDQAAAELDQTVATMLKDIGAHYRAERLSVVERPVAGLDSPVAYSQPAEFLNQLINFNDEPFPLDETDLGKALNSHALTFGFNALESKSADNRRRYGAVVSLKQYREVAPGAVDRLMQAPMEFIVSQSLLFVPPAKALKSLKAQKELFEISGDDYSTAASGLEDMLANDHGQPTDFGEIQTTVMVTSDEYRHLDEEVVKVQQAFADMGLITVREDIKLEECFWSQLPGNFSFIRRRDTVATARAAGFCRLNLFPSGADTGNHWGDAVTLLPTTVGSPYFFNFHHKDNGHTAFLDFNSFHDNAGRVLLHFLLTASLKYRGRMFVFDRRQSARLWFGKIGGHYHPSPFSPQKGGGKDAFRLNPFSLGDNKRNRSFLLAWLVALIEPPFAVGEHHREILFSAIDALYQKPAADRHLQTLVDLIAASDGALAKAFAPFVGQGAAAGVFDAKEETLDLRHSLHAFDMDTGGAHRAAVVPLFAYLLHHIISGLDGKPAIIVLQEAWDLLDNNFFAPRLESLLEMFKQNNVMVIAATENPEYYAGKPSFTAFLQNAATKIYLPDDLSVDYAGQLPGLRTGEAKLLSAMDRQRGDFLLTQNDEDIALRAELEGMDDLKAIFAGDVKTLIAAGGKFASLPQGYRHDEDTA